MFASEYLIYPLRIGNYTFHLHLNTIIYTWLVSLLIIGIAIYLRAKWEKVPKPYSLQNLIEATYEFIYNINLNIMPEEMANKYTPLIFTFFIFILLSNWLGVFPDILPYKVQPTSDYNTTLALALVSVVGYNIISLRHIGFSHWLKHFIHPLPMILKERNLIVLALIPFLALLFTVLNLMEIFARGLSLSVRLFGNIFSEHQLTFTMASLAGKFNPIGLAVFFLLLFSSTLGLLAGFIQALIFTVLTAAYIGTSIGEE